MEVYRSDYWVISFEQEIGLMIPRWFENSIELTDELYKLEMENYTQMVEKYRPTKALIDTVKFGYPIPPTIQDWTNTTLFPRILAVGVKRVAIVMPDEILTMLSLEQVMEEAIGLQFSTKYFSDEDLARKWLMD